MAFGSTPAARRAGRKHARNAASSGGTGASIQTFKGMPAIRVLRIMEQAFTPNLGVGCNHCHVPGQWSSDDKPTKNIARRMWTMRAEWQEEVRTASGNPDAVVTCYTCHKGQAKPAFAPDQAARN